MAVRRLQNQQDEVLVKLLGWFENLNSVFLIMEYFPYGDLEQNRANVREKDVREIAWDLIEGLKIIHAEGFVHRDLKPQVCLFYFNPTDFMAV
jgi:serine/threonine protein kinase